MMKINLLVVALIIFSTICRGQATSKTAMPNSKLYQSENATSNDSIRLMAAFEQLKKDKKFQEELCLTKDTQYTYSDLILKPLFGDLNNDGLQDALLIFSVEGRGGGNNWDAHYAVFLHHNGDWQYQSQINAGGDLTDRILEFTNIKDGKVMGQLIGNKDESLEAIPVEYIFKDGRLLNIYTALHKGDSTESAFIKPEYILTKKLDSLPLTGTLKIYEQILGRGKTKIPEEQPECGTYFDEGVYSECIYPGITIELQNYKNAAWRKIDFQNSHFKLQTDKGTIDEKTTLDELVNLLRKDDRWWVDQKEEGSAVLTIFGGEESDNLLKIYFDKAGKTVSIELVIPC